MFKWANRTGIAWKVLLCFIIFIVVVLAVLWASQVVFLDSIYKSIKVGDIEDVAATVKDNIDNPNLETLLQQLAERRDLAIVVFDANGNNLAISDSFSLAGRSLQEMPWHQKKYYYAQAQNHDGVYIERYDRNSEPTQIQSGQETFDVPPIHNRAMESILYTEVVRDRDVNQVAIMINSLISPVASTVSTLRVLLVYITIAMLLLAVVLALVMARKISRPIVKINASAKELAQGKYDTVFAGAGYKEIAELSDTLNYAAHELSKVEGLRNELIANISHDLRTPLTMITGYAEVMRDLPDETTPENIQVIIDESRRLTSLVNDVVDVSKLQSDTVEMKLEPFDLTESIREIMGRYSKLTEQDGYQISFTYDDDVIVEADELRISQVLYNLINNAITYTGDNKRVEVIQSCHDGLVRISVRDNGIGIPADKLEYIWDRYFKVDKVHRRAAVGSGLGLSIVKKILDRHQAVYGVSSVEGEGSTFWFELPYLDEPDDDEM